MNGYRYEWALFVDWCAAAEIDPLPAGPAVLAEFLSDNPAKHAGQLRRVSAVNRAHLDAGHAAPGRVTSLRLALDSARAEIESASRTVLSSGCRVRGQSGRCSDAATPSCCSSPGQDCPTGPLPRSVRQYRPVGGVIGRDVRVSWKTFVALAGQLNRHLPSPGGDGQRVKSVVGNLGPDVYLDGAKRCWNALGEVLVSCHHS